MKTNDKFFLVDLGFRRIMRRGDQGNLGHLLENVVYLELIRRGNMVSVGKYQAAEVDFVAYHPNEGTSYFQVTTSMMDETVAEKELKALRAILDAFPKTVLSLDAVHMDDYQGIRHLNLLEWLCA